MAHVSKIDQFQERVRDALIAYLPEGFEVDSNRPFSLVRQQSWGRQHVSVAPMTRGWPYASMNLFFGVSFHAVDRVKQTAGLRNVPHVFSMSSMNLYHMKGLNYWGRWLQRLPDWIYMHIDRFFWRCHRDEPPQKIARRLRHFIRGVLRPFFSRFDSLVAVRQSHELDDNWLFSSGDAKEILLLDFALNDVAHFHKYRQEHQHDRNYRVDEEKLRKLIEAYPQFSD